MARLVSYEFRGQQKTVNFAFDQYRDIFEAAAAAEGVDISAFLRMEQQVAMTAKGGGALKSFRLHEFARMGFTNVKLLKTDD
ncbi:DUF2960 domain-containing protein [Shewanella fodinae]|jgi:hypothetical protein|uniref:DUF2960 family protein n=1 Tax=Shewanella fodinae TaxID=552357 RepID=A0A4R2FA22_9GAMM|nr:DUF2960 domain-containing protein [Shewanella fodinae]MCD8476414.1 DUF2960 domain-containing protein [Shewanella fodinae]TCN82079.1 DUF2960 family protein [Shewanella fodinae]